MIRRLATVLCLTLLVLLVSCTDKVNPNQSRLLDGAQAYFLGDPAQKEMPGKAVAWEDQLLLSGRRRALDAPKSTPYKGFLWLVGENGRVLWEKNFDTLDVFDLAVADSAHVFVLLNPPREGHSGEFYLWKLNRAGEVVQRTKHSAPQNMWASRLTAMTSDRFLITAWRLSPDSTELLCASQQVSGAGAPLEASWDYPSARVFPLRDGGFLAKREREYARHSEALIELARLRPDGSLAWKVEQPLDTTRAALMGVAEAADGALLLTGHGQSLFEPVIARLSAAGQLAWVKRPPRMEGYELYNLVPWGSDRFLVCAQKPLGTGRFSKDRWDCFAAFVIDAEGNVLDSDLLPQFWTMPVGGVLAGRNGRCWVVGAGGADVKGFAKQWDIAIYTLAHP